MPNASDKGTLADYASLSSDELIARLLESEETLDAIRAGEVDAVVVGGLRATGLYARKCGSTVPCASRTDAGGRGHACR